MPTKVPQPWDRFLRSVDKALVQPVDLHCLGGFAVSMLYSLPRPTADIDVLEIRPPDETEHLLKLAGEGSALHAKHGVYLQKVTVNNYPASYDERLKPIFAGIYTKVRLFGLDPYDLALSKLERNTARDRQDVGHLVHFVPLDPAVLRDRYMTDMRPYMGRPEREDLTIKLWLEEFFPKGI